MDSAMKKILLIIGSILLLLAVPIGVYFIRQQQDIRKKAAPATTLSLLPSTITKKVGETFSLEVAIDTGENQVIAVEVYLVYDPLKLEAQSITNGSAFPNILKSGVVDRGTATITVGTPDTSRPMKGTGTVAVVKFTTLEATDASISVKFASNTFVGGIGETTANVLVGTSPAGVTVRTDATVTPSPTVTVDAIATPTATPSATMTPTATPSATLTPTPTGTASAEVSPSAIAILTPVSQETVNVGKPTLKGTALPNTSVTITIYSQPRTIVVTSDLNGNWSYTPDTSLEEGPHSLVVSAPDGNGVTQTATTSFVVASGAEGTEPQSAIPIAGSVELTLFWLATGCVLLFVGMIFPTSVKHRYE